MIIARPTLYNTKMSSFTQQKHKWKRMSLNEKDYVLWKCYGGVFVTSLQSLFTLMQTLEYNYLILFSLKWVELLWSCSLGIVAWEGSVEA